MTVSYQPIEVPADPKPVDAVKTETKTEPVQPELPAGRDYTSVDIRAQRLGLYAVALRKWGRGLITAIDARETAADAIIARQTAERKAALARLKTLQDAESE